MSIRIDNIDVSGGSDSLTRNFYISPVEKIILRLAEEGKTIKEIAEELKLTVRSVQLKLIQLHQRLR
jgi:DNA-binding NarL/FixJ family response regulator